MRGVIARTVVAWGIVGSATALAVEPVQGWRGDGSGRFVAEPPTEWSAEKNVLWKAKLPGPSHASPVLAEDVVLVTAEPSQLLCLDRESGDVRWEHSHTYADAFGAETASRIEADQQQAKQLEKQQEQLRREQTQLEQQEPPPAERIANLKQEIKDLDAQRDELLKFPPPKGGANGNATSTPVSDGQHVWAVFGTGIVSCHSLAGERVWMKHVETRRESFGHSASPVLVGGRLIVHLVDLVALEPHTGKEIWRVKLPARWGTPVVAELDGRQVLVTPGGAVVAVDDGELFAKGLFDMEHSSPVVNGQTVYALDTGKLKAVELKRGDKVAVQPLWEKSATRQRRFATLVCHEGLLYAITEHGILDVIDAETGESIYRRRTGLGEKRVYASPTIAGNLLYLCDNEGKSLVLRPGREYDQVAENELEKATASPVFAGRRMYVRGAEHLYCIGE